mmetsp:Transcript_1533/g.4857  ORF Transcript_1533/g.4857 Transcript_1533/m.4857 type:complete len:231 (-) Transcript_1533:220-912(-)
MRPPGLRSCTAREAMSSWRRWLSAPLRGDQRFQMSGLLRMVPSPEHGTSHRIRSNARRSPGAMRDGKVRALWWVTRRLAMLSRWHWCTRSRQRLRSTSLATTSPDGGPGPGPDSIISISCWVLDPGEAQRSSTVCSGRTSSTRGGIMDTSSWRLTLPTSVSLRTNLCSSCMSAASTVAARAAPSSPSCTRPRNSARVTSAIQASSCGYQPTACSTGPSGVASFGTSSFFR